MARERRANAGNRLQALLEDQTPLDDDEAKFFAEKDDDIDFDLWSLRDCGTSRCQTGCWSIKKPGAQEKGLNWRNRLGAVSVW